MNKLYGRTIISVILSGLLILGLIFFLVEFFISGSDWASDRSNSLIYTAGVPDNVKITDRSGETLFAAENGQYSFNDSTGVRVATLHAIGDLQGNIGSGVLRRCRSKLLGYSVLTGVYHNMNGGSTLSLNLDAEVCAAAYNALGRYKGTVGVYNYKTGELYCMVSTPSFDISAAPEIEDGNEQWEGVYLNRFLSAAYPPGSIFKILTTQAALESVEGIEEMTFTCEGSCEIGGETITCSGYHGEQDIYAALANSCNCAYAKISQLVGAQELQKYAERAGITKAGQIDGYPTTAGEFDLSDASEAELSWAGIGQYNDLINPCTYLRYLGAVANGGVAVSPSLLGSMVYGTGAASHAGSAPSETIMPEASALKLQDMMRNNVEKTYGAWRFGDLDVCAKSGTAQLDADRSHSVFCGFIRDEQLPLAFIAIVENAGSGQGVAMQAAVSVINTAVQQLAAQ